MKNIIAIVLSLFTNVALACSCLQSTDEEAYKSSSSVLLVRVESTEFIPSTKPMEFDSVRAKFSVIETYKSNGQSLKYLKTEKTTCEMALISGEYYLVYSNGNETKLLNACTRSRWVNRTKEKDLLDEYSSRNK